MNARTALRWTALYKAVAWLSGLVGLALVVLPLYFYGTNDIGFGLAVEKVSAQPLLAIPVVLGFVVWQVGKTVAYYRTVTGAVRGELADQFDPELIKSDILSVLDERLADMQSQVEGTRRAVEDMNGGQSSQSGDFGFQE
jgi:hypothetical protein